MSGGKRSPIEDACVLLHRTSNPDLSAFKICLNWRLTRMTSVSCQLGLPRLNIPSPTTRRLHPTAYAPVGTYIGVPYHARSSVD